MESRSHYSKPDPKLNAVVDAVEIPIEDTPTTRIQEIIDRLGPVVTALVIAALSGIVLSFLILFIRAAGLYSLVALGPICAGAAAFFAFRYSRKLDQKEEAETKELFARVQERFSKLEALTGRLVNANRRVEQRVIQRFKPLSERGSAMFQTSRRLQGLLDERVKRLRPFLTEPERSRLGSAETILDLPIAFSLNLAESPGMPTLPADKWDETVEIFVREMDAELERAAQSNS